MNIHILRKRNHMTQEELAERIQVSRQAIAKWEKGISTPDLEKCIELARVFQVSVDDLIQYDEEEEKLPIPPKGKYCFGSVTVGERGQIVIPKKARDIFSIHSGDHLLILGDVDQGLAIIPENALQQLFDLVHENRILLREKNNRRSGERKNE